MRQFIVTKQRNLAKSNPVTVLTELPLTEKMAAFQMDMTSSKDD